MEENKYPCNHSPKVHSELGPILVLNTSMPLYSAGEQNILI